ncbi:hypothetical protein JCM11641_008310 [Rhodosporidiobolus odoratus]
MDCFVCRQALHGDPSFVQHHLNHCLDGTGSPYRSPPNTTRPQPARNGASPSTPHLHLSSPTLPLSPGAAQFRSDAALALSLAQQLEGTERTHSADARAIRTASEQEKRERADRELALALARAQEAEARTERRASPRQRQVSLAETVATTASEREACPCCEARWGDIGLRLASTPERSATDGQQVADRRRKHVQACLQGREKLVAQLGDVGLGLLGAWDVDDKAEGEGEFLGLSWTGGVGSRDEVQGTVGLIPLLQTYLTKSSTSSHGRTAEAYLAVAATEHISTRLKDWGWGCGYKNAQMLFSSLRYLPSYASLSSTSSGSSNSTSKHSVEDALPTIPTIREWQDLIEAAWKAGHDPPGRAHFNGHLVGSRRWIGTTEVYTALTWMGVRATIIDFPKVPGADGSHQSLTRWIIDYFSSPSTASSASPASSSAALSASHLAPPAVPPKNAFSLLSCASGSPIHVTDKQPLYLQHRGHSRTIVGIEIGKAGRSVKGKGKKVGGGSAAEEAEMWLLLFDPGKPIPQDVKRAAAKSSSTFPPLKKQKSSPTASTSRLAFGKGDKDGDELKSGDVLKVFRVKMKELKKKDEYQILYVSPGPPLSAAEKLARRQVKSKLAPTSKIGSNNSNKIA